MSDFLHDALYLQGTSEATIKRWPIIRHLRWLWYSWQLARWMQFWSRAGLTLPNIHDLEYLNRVWRGEE